MQTLARTDFQRSGKISEGKSAALFADGKKWCPRCRRVKPRAAFSHNRAGSTGLSGACRKCRKLEKSERIARNAGQPDPTALARFNSKVLKIPKGCWIWRGALDERGHGIFTIRAKSILAHRAAVEIFGGEIPAGKASWLTCRVPPCVNPAHVIFCSRRELSTIHAKDNPFARNARKEKCDPHGHEYTPENTHWHYALGTRGGVGRICIACHKLRKPNTTIKPNTREDALSKRSMRLTELAFNATKHLNRAIRDDVRGELMAYLLARKSAPRGEKLAALVKRLARAEWKLVPDPFGRSVDAPIGEDGNSLLDLVHDLSILGDPEALWLTNEAAAIEE